MKQMTLKEIKELAHMTDNNHIATVLANYYYRESQRMKQEGYPNASDYYLGIWRALVGRLDELEIDDFFEEEEN